MDPPRRPAAPEDLVAAVTAVLTGTPADGRPLVVAVDGRSGSGKTSLAGVLAPALAAPCVHLDDWVPGWHGLAASVDLLVTWVLRPLAEGRPARWRCWDWARGEFGAEVTLEPPSVVVVEGCGAGSAPARPWIDALVWLDVDAGERLARLARRDDWDLFREWEPLWSAQEEALAAGDDPAAHADVVVAADGTVARRHRSR